MAEIAKIGKVAVIYTLEEESHLIGPGILREGPRLPEVIESVNRNGAIIDYHGGND